MSQWLWARMQWSWMGISLDNGDRISLWDIIDGDKEHAFATLLHPDGRHEIVDVEPLAQGATSIWTSAASGHRYPTDWVVSIPTLKARLCVEPLVREQEMVSPIGIHKYEGASKVAVVMQGEPVTGHAVVELVGTGFNLPAVVGEGCPTRPSRGLLSSEPLPSFPCSAFR